MDREHAVCTCKNGARLLWVNVPGKMLYLKIVVNVGSDAEDSNTVGISHYLEHLQASMTSSRYPSGRKNQKLFTSYGATRNAHTTSDHCAYWIKFHEDQASVILDVFMSAFSDFKADKSILKEEANAVRQELKSIISSDWNDLDCKTNALLYPSHRRSIHTKKELKNVDKLYSNMHLVDKWRKRYYVPENMLVVFGGDWKSSQYKRGQATVTKHLHTLQASQGPWRQKKYHAAFPSGMHMLPLSNASTTHVYMQYPLPFGSEDVVMASTVFMWNILLSKDLGCRLYELRYEKGGMLYSVDTFVNLDVDPRLSEFVVTFDCDAKNVGQLVKRVKHELSRPVSKDELQRVVYNLNVEHATEKYKKSPEYFCDMYMKDLRQFGKVISNKNKNSLQAKFLRQGGLSTIQHMFVGVEPLVVYGTPNT